MLPKVTGHVQKMQVVQDGRKYFMNLTQIARDNNFQILITTPKSPQTNMEVASDGYTVDSERVHTDEHYSNYSKVVEGNVASGSASCKLGCSSTMNDVNNQSFGNEDENVINNTRYEEINGRRIVNIQFFFLKF